MEKEKVKKPLPATTVKKQPRPGMKDYFKGVKTELKKVVWPTKKELVSYTSVVLLTCVAFGVGIWLVDSAFLAALKYVLNITF